MKIEEVYTPLEQAREQVRRRWNDKVLRQSVEDFLGSSPSDGFAGPRACLWRAVHSPNREFCRFAKLAKATGCQPYALAWHSDRFCSTNPEKSSLIRMPCITGINKYGDPVLHRVKIADAPEFEGIPFRDITTYWGESFVDFHYRLLHVRFPEITPTDESSWLIAHGESPKCIYPAVLARFICHGILFDNFEDKASESFVHTVVLPAFESVFSLFGIKPLIVPLLNKNTSGDSAWTLYEGRTVETLTQSLATYNLQR